MSAFSHEFMSSSKNTSSNEFGRKEIELDPKTLAYWRSTHSSHNIKKSKRLIIFWKNGSYRKLLWLYSKYRDNLGQLWKASRNRFFVKLTVISRPKNHLEIVGTAQFQAPVALPPTPPPHPSYSGHQHRCQSTHQTPTDGNTDHSCKFVDIISQMRCRSAF